MRKGLWTVGACRLGQGLLWPGILVLYWIKGRRVDRRLNSLSWLRSLVQLTLEWCDWGFILKKTSALWRSKATRWIQHWSNKRWCLISDTNLDKNNLVPTSCVVSSIYRSVQTGLLHTWIKPLHEYNCTLSIYWPELFVLLKANGFRQFNTPPFSLSKGWS